MEQVPKIVSERLKAAAPAIDHPDADILTAFSERSLPEQERIGVLKHLSHCADCREILALSLPETEAVQQVLPAPKTWFAWPTLRWGFAAAGIVIVASLGLLQYRKQSSFVAQRSTPPPMVEPAPGKKADAAPSPEPPPPASATSDASSTVLKLEQETAKLEAKSAARDEASSTSAQAAPSRMYALNQKNLPHGPAAANQMQLNMNLQQQNSSALQQAQVQVPLTAKKQLRADQGADVTQSLTVEVAAAAPPAAPQPERKLEIQSQSLDQQTLNGGQAESQVDSQNFGAVGFSTKARGPVRSPVAVGSAVGLATQSTRWTISSAGGLQRSIDQGKTWQDIDVNQSPAAPASLMLAKNAPPKDLADSESKDKIERSKSASIVFRAVSANGPDVWAGGSSGLLYHSTDSGAHWTRVIPASGGATLTGEVLTVSFIDPQHGKVSTSTSELWTTTNGGQTWDKQ